MKNTRIWGVLLALLLPIFAFSQNLTQNPYSRFGVGEIVPTTTARNMAMGDIGVATFNYASVNRLNPASYADLIYTTFDISGFARSDRLSTADAEQNQFSAGFQNLMFGFPSNNAPAVALGFAPYSGIGYEIIQNKNLVRNPGDTLRTAVSYSAEGGLNQIFGGIGTRLLQRKLQLGINVNYTFGNLRYRTQSVTTDPLAQSTTDLRISNRVFVGGLGFQGGVMYTDTLQRVRRNMQTPLLIRFGAAAETSFDLSGDQVTVIANNTYNYADTINGGLREGSVTLPPRIAVGVGLFRAGMFEVSAEIAFQDWQNFQFFDENPDLSRSIRVAAGGEWIPNIGGTRYYERMAYRVGGHYEQTYFQVDGEPVPDYGVSFGLGLPASRRGTGTFNRERAYSQVSLGASIGRRGTIKSSQLEDFYIVGRVGITINERWFRRIRID